jgi:hypothetical protein
MDGIIATASVVGIAVGQVVGRVIGQDGVGDEGCISFFFRNSSPMHLLAGWSTSE